MTPESQRTTQRSRSELTGGHREPDGRGISIRCSVATLARATDRATIPAAAPYSPRHSVVSSMPTPLS
jgi:hypothetical protein